MHVFCRQWRSFDLYVAMKSVCVPRVMAKFVFHRKCTYAKFVLCVAMKTAHVLPAVDDELMLNVLRCQLTY